MSTIPQGKGRKKLHRTFVPCGKVQPFGHIAYAPYVGAAPTRQVTVRSGPLGDMAASALRRKHKNSRHGRKQKEKERKKGFHATRWFKRRKEGTQRRSRRRREGARRPAPSPIFAHYTTGKGATVATRKEEEGMGGQRKKKVRMGRGAPPEKDGGGKRPPGGEVEVLPFLFLRETFFIHPT